MRTMHLFAGAGGGLLADLILGHTPIVAVEWDRYACQVLRERAAEGWFPELHVWEGDVRLFDPSEYTGKVDCIHAGFPCQDISVAGKQAGLGEKTRSGLYREVLRIAGIVRPRYIFLENVAAIVSNGLGTVIADLAALGYDAEWLCLRASDCGAQHHRDRWWCLSYRNSDSEPASAINAKPLCEADMADPKRSSTYKRYKTEMQRRREKKTEQTWMGDSGIPNPERIRPSGQGESLNAVNSKAVGDRQAAQPLNGGFRGFWSFEPELGRVANGVACRVDRLKAIGNGQVPLQAAVAWRLLGGE
jgi:DNA (cytosine-5)-methyltransferase 1